MRLIDADALMMEFSDWWYSSFGMEETEQSLTIREAMHAIEEQPTIEPERKKGKWIETKADEPCFYRCSECGRLMDEESIYCPNCGAEMRGTK